MAAASSPHDAAAAVVVVRVVERFSVSPPTGSAPAEASLPLTFFDTTWLYGNPVERIFFYAVPHSTAHFVEHILPGLKSSLALALRHFYPLAGRVRPTPGADGQYELHYADGSDAVSLTLAECAGGAGFRELSGDPARDLAALRTLVPRLPDPQGDGTRPLLAVQVTVFPNHGVALGVTVHHVACDGAAAVHFIKSWAAACRSGASSSFPVDPLPVYDRTLVADTLGLYSILLETNSAPDAAGARQEVVLLSTFTLGREHIERLKRRAAAKAHCSSFVVACAYVWVCLVRTRREFHGDKVAYFVCTADCRARLRPPLPQGYFGNCLRGCIAEANAGDLAGEDGFVVAAEAIRRAIEELGEGESLLKGGAEVMSRIGPVMRERPMSLSGSPKFRVYDADFGWGKPVKVEITSIVHYGSVALAESSDGKGGIELGLVLPEAEMDVFSAHFSGGLEAELEHE